MIKKNVIFCLALAVILAAYSHASIIGSFDGSGIGTTYTSFSSLEGAYAGFMGVSQNSITFSEYDAGTVITNQYSASKGVTFSNTGQQLACVMYEGNNGVSGYVLEPLDGYDGSYEPDMDKALAEYPNDGPSPFTISFASPVSTVGSFIGMGKEGSIDTLTVTALDAMNNVLGVITVKTDPWQDPSNREGFWGIKSDSADIAKIIIHNDSNVNYANALIFDNLQWSNQPTTSPEPATIVILSFGVIGCFVKRK